MLRSHLTDDLTLILGARASWYDYSSHALSGTGAVTTSTMKESSVITPYAGLVYALSPQWSLYGSYADIFQPQTQTDEQLQVLKPIVGVNYEVGIKGEMFGGALNTSLAVFRIDQRNRAVIDYDAPMNCGGRYCYRAAGKVRSQGVELEVNGQLTPGWQVSAGYTWSENEYLADANPDLIGKPFSYMSPKHILRVWSDWQLPGDWSKWRVGLGVNYRSKQETGNSTKLNPVQGGYSVWNARVAYQINKAWSATLHIENLFDKYYYSSIQQGYTLNQFGAPRNVLLTVRGSF